MLLFFSSEKNKKLEQELEERIQRHLSITEVCLDEDVEELEEDLSLPELTNEMQAVIEDALSAPHGKVLIDLFRIPIERKDLSTLTGLNWLNDEVINFYMQMICERSKQNDNWPNVYAFNTFFYPKLMSGGHQVLKRWTKKVDVFSFDLILVPVHLGMHWCLSTIDLRSKTVRYYDSMSGNNRECLNALVGYLEKEHLDKKKTSYDTSE